MGRCSGADPAGKKSILFQTSVGETQEGFRASTTVLRPCKGGKKKRANILEVIYITKKKHTQPQNKTTKKKKNKKKKKEKKRGSADQLTCQTLRGTCKLS